MISLTRIFAWAFSIPKTVFFNFYLLPFKTAIKFPFLVDYRIKLYEVNKGTVEIIGNVKFGMVRLGWGEGSGGVECNRFSYWGIKKNCKVIFNGEAQFARGVSLRADSSGKIIFGKNFAANQNFFCASNTIISFGDDVLLGWNVHVRDGDGHIIFNDEKNTINANKPVSIGNHVWIASYASVLKGVVIDDDCIVGFSSIVTRSFSEKNIIITGTPATVVKRNISWKK